MLMKRARAYSSSYSHVVYFYPLCRNLLFRSQKSGKITKTPYFEGSKTFKVINVDASKKHATSALLR